MEYSRVLQVERTARIEVSYQVKETASEYGVLTGIAAHVLYKQFSVLSSLGKLIVDWVWIYI